MVLSEPEKSISDLVNTLSLTQQIFSTVLAAWAQANEKIEETKLALLASKTCFNDSQKLLQQKQTQCNSSSQSSDDLYYQNDLLCIKNTKGIVDVEDSFSSDEQEPYQCFAKVDENELIEDVDDTKEEYDDNNNKNNYDVVEAVLGEWGCPTCGYPNRKERSFCLLCYRPHFTISNIPVSTEVERNVNGECGVKIGDGDCFSSEPESEEFLTTKSEEEEINLNFQEPRSFQEISECSFNLEKIAEEKYNMKIRSLFLNDENIPEDYFNLVSNQVWVFITRSGKILLENPYSCILDAVEFASTRKAWDLKLLKLRKIEIQLIKEARHL